MATAYKVVRYALSTSQWTDVVVPQNCSTIRLTNEDEANVQLMRSDKGDSTTQRAFLPSAVIELRSPVEAFEARTTVCSLLSQTGAGPVVAEFIR